MGLHSKQRSCFDITHSSISFWAQKWELGRVKQAFSIPNTSAYTRLLKKKKDEEKKSDPTALNWVSFTVCLEKNNSESPWERTWRSCHLQLGCCSKTGWEETLRSAPPILGTPWNVLGSPCFIWTTCELCRPPQGLKNMQLSYGCPTVSCGNKQSSL